MGLSPKMKEFIEKEYKELTDHFHSSIKSKDSMGIWYYTGALAELATLKGFVGYKDKEG